MRALCGAIIAAGSFIGLGLACIGEGLRYTAVGYHTGDGKPLYVHFNDMDGPLMITFLGLGLCALIGLGIAFVGLAYHHHHRSQELLHLHHNRGTDAARGPGERVTV